MKKLSYRFLTLLFLGLISRNTFASDVLLKLSNIDPNGLYVQYTEEKNPDDFRQRSKYEARFRSNGKIMGSIDGLERGYYFAINKEKASYNKKHYEGAVIALNGIISKYSNLEAIDLTLTLEEERILHVQIKESQKVQRERFSQKTLEKVLEELREVKSQLKGLKVENTQLKKVLNDLREIAPLPVVEEKGKEIKNK